MSLEDLSRSFEQSKASLVCLCSSDAVYAEEGAAALKALRALTTGPIYVAGRPAELADTFATSGATGFIYAGCDAVAILQDALAAAVASPR